MDRYKQQSSLRIKGAAYKILVAIAVVAGISLYMPREESAAYQFDLGKPWRYTQLIAPYDFPIYKSDDAVAHEQDSILKNYEPYYSVIEYTVTEELARFREDFQKELSHSIPAYYRPYIERKLEHIYRQGILEMEDYDRLVADSIRTLQIVQENRSSQRTLQEVFSQKSAYEYLTQHIEDTAAYHRNLLIQCNLIDYVTPNLTFDAKKSEEQRKELLASLTYAKGMVLSGQKIIDRGDIVDEQTYDILTSFEQEDEKRNSSSIERYMIFAGQFFFVLIVTICLILYFIMFRIDYLNHTPSLLFLALMTIIYPIITSFLMKHNLLNVYIIPYAMAPIFMRVFMDSRTAFVTHVSTILLCSIVLNYPYEFIATQLIAGMTAIYSLRELSQRSQLLRTAFFVMLSTIIFYASMELIQERSFARLNYNLYLYMVLNGALLLLAYPLLFLLEKMFGFTSNVTLVELSNINNDLLRQLSEVAPGTFQHSMQVANLATAVANRIGGKPQLVRTGALYHDIGKMGHPVYFTENQKNINPHERLTCEQSATVVISHVTEGIKLAEKHNLPQSIKDFILTHHGKGMTKFFYISYKNEHPHEKIDVSRFTYPGPNPFTLEQAILMMADAVEASSRSLNEYTEESINEQVDKIVNGQVAEGYFENCPITFQDIAQAKAVFKDKLKSIYHTRIGYPELKN